MIISSRDNPRVKRWAKLSEDGRFRRGEGRALLEGPHLVAALLQAGIKPVCVVVSEASDEERQLAAGSGAEVVEVSRAVMKAVCDAETPQGIAAEIEIPKPRLTKADSVFLEGIQDAGNVGAIIRTSAAFGIGSILLDSACADPWSPKVLRAGAGGHFALSIQVVPDLAKELAIFPGTLLCTVATGGRGLDAVGRAGRLGWVFGSEGRGLSAGALDEADLKITVPIAPGTESLNVAATAAVCLYSAFNRPAAGS
jgi:TrmH family RNA methyltransferase